MAPSVLCAQALVSQRRLTLLRAFPVAKRVSVVLGVTLVHGPFARLAQSFTRDEVAGGRRLVEHQHDRRHKGVTKLHIVGVKAVSADERDAIREEALEGHAHS